MYIAVCGVEFCSSTFCVHLHMYSTVCIHPYRHYEYSSSGESSPELPVLSKHPPLHAPHTSHSSPPSGVPPCASRERGESEPGTPPYYSGYNSAEEYEATHRPFFDHEVCVYTYCMSFSYGCIWCK